MRRRIFKQENCRISGVCFPDVLGADAIPAAARPTREEELEAAAAQRGREVVAKASAEAERLRAAALAEAREQAVKLYEEPLLAALSALASAKASMENAAAAAAAKAEKELVGLVIKVAEKVIRRKLENDEDEVFLMISRAIQAVPKGKTLLIRVNERDYENIQKAGQAIPTAAKLAGSLAMEISPDVEPGGCVVITEAGAVNANPSRQLEIIEEALLKEVSCGL